MDTVLELVNKRLKNVEKRGNCFVGFIEGEKNLTSFIEEFETINQVAFQTCKLEKRVKENGEQSKRLPGEGKFNGVVFLFRAGMFAVGQSSFEYCGGEGQRPSCKRS